MTSATDELHRLLDERGVEWGAEESELDHVTTWNANGGQAMFYESKTTNPNLLQVNYYDLTPAQAVEATLGRGTCHAESDLSEWVCSACQCWIPLGLTPENIQYASEWRYCPHCGAEVKAVSDDER